MYLSSTNITYIITKFRLAIIAQGQVVDGLLTGGEAVDISTGTRIDEGHSRLYNKGRQGI